VLLPRSPQQQILRRELPLERAFQSPIRLMKRRRRNRRKRGKNERLRKK